MKEQVKTPVLVLIVVAVVGILIFVGMNAMKSGDLDQGQVKYTPGKPPWQETDPSKKGPGGGPPPTGAPSGAAPGGNAPPSNAPPGMSPPKIGNGP